MEQNIDRKEVETLLKYNECVIRSVMEKSIREANGLIERVKILDGERIRYATFCRDEVLYNKLIKRYYAAAQALIEKDKVFAA